MTKMLENQIDPPEGTAIPGGLTVIRELSNKVSDAAIADEIYEPAGPTRNNLEEITHHALRGDADKTLAAVIQMISEAGESQYAIDEWLKEMVYDAGE